MAAQTKPVVDRAVGSEGWNADVEHEREAEVEEQGKNRTKKDALADLESRIEAAIEEARPRIKRAFDQLDARVDAAMAEIRPKVEGAVDDVKPKMARLLADAQPRLDAALERIQAKITELRKELEERAARQNRSEITAALPRSAGSDAAAAGEEPEDRAGAGEDKGL